MIPIETMIASNTTRLDPTKPIIVWTLNNVSAGSALPCTPEDFAAANINQKPIIGNDASASAKNEYKPFHDITCGDTVPAVYRIIPIRKAGDPPKRRTLSAKLPGAP